MLIVLTFCKGFVSKPDVEERLPVFGQRHIALYLWFRRDGVWKRRQKFVFRSREEWDKAKNAVEGLAGML